MGLAVDGTPRCSVWVTPEKKDREHRRCTCAAKVSIGPFMLCVLHLGVLMSEQEIRVVTEEGKQQDLSLTHIPKYIKYVSEIDRSSRLRKRRENQKRREKEKENQFVDPDEHRRALRRQDYARKRGRTLEYGQRIYTSHMGNLGTATGDSRASRDSRMAEKEKRTPV